MKTRISVRKRVKGEGKAIYRVGSQRVKGESKDKGEKEGEG